MGIICKRAEKISTHRWWNRHDSTWLVIFGSKESIEAGLACCHARFLGESEFVLLDQINEVLR